MQNGVILVCTKNDQPVADWIPDVIQENLDLGEEIILYEDNEPIEEIIGEA